MAALQRLAGALPAFGIVAAVLGVVNTMGSVGQPPAVLGGMIGSALVGTFLGILLAYAFAEPLAGLLEQKVDEGRQGAAVHQDHAARQSMQGYAPQVAVEFGRKVLYSTERPTFAELEKPREGQEVTSPCAPAQPRIEQAPRNRLRRAASGRSPWGASAEGASGGGSSWPVTRRSCSRSSSSASRRAATATMAARGRSPMPTS